MALSIVDTASTFTNYADLALPSADAWTGLWYFGTDDENRVNQINGVAAVEVGGTAANKLLYGKGFVDILGGTEGGAINTDVMPAGLDLGRFTMITVSNVHQATANNRNILVGTQHSGITGGYIQQNNLSALGAWNGSSALSATGGVAGALQFAAITRTDAGARTVYLHDGTTLQSATGTGANLSPAPNNFRIGSYGTAITTGSTSYARHAAAGILNQALTAAQLLDVYAYLKFKLGRRGIAVV